jgi:hypothetical protein
LSFSPSSIGAKAQQQVAHWIDQFLDDFLRLQRKYFAVNNPVTKVIVTLNKKANIPG